MVYIISLIGILLEQSLPFNADIYIVSLSFLMYLVSLKQERNIIFVILVGLLNSLQTDSFLKITLIFLITYGVMRFLFQVMLYRRLSIIPITLIQISVYIILNMENLKLDYIILNFIGCMVLNYIYVQISKRNKEDRGH